MKTEKFTPHTLKIGEHVVRGPSWNWGNQDASGVGVIINMREQLPELTKKFTVKVKWPDGSTNVYRVLSDDGIYHDLLRVVKKNIIIF